MQSRKVESTIITYKVTHQETYKVTHQVTYKVTSKVVHDKVYKVIHKVTCNLVLIDIKS